MWHTPQACTRTSASPGPGSGTHDGLERDRRPLGQRHDASDLRCHACTPCRVPRWDAGRGPVRTIGLTVWSFSPSSDPAPLDPAALAGIAAALRPEPHAAAGRLRGPGRVRLGAAALLRRGAGCASAAARTWPSPGTSGRNRGRRRRAARPGPGRRPAGLRQRLPPPRATSCCPAGYPDHARPGRSARTTRGRTRSTASCGRPPASRTRAASMPPSTGSPQLPVERVARLGLRRRLGCTAPPLARRWRASTRSSRPTSPNACGWRGATNTGRRPTGRS